jgi:hypothetical protein
MDFAVEPVTSMQWPALEDLFGRSGASNGSSHRGLGVMDALIEAALPAAASASAPALEAYPVDTTVPSHTGNLFPGIAAVFARHGFQVVARRKPDRPVMRKAFRPA